MKVLITALLILFSAPCFADNPIEQYCDKVQYGYLYKENLYTLPYGLGWQFPKPPTGVWQYKAAGFAGANNYQLQCNLPIDDWLPAVVLCSSIIGVVYIKKKSK